MIPDQSFTFGNRRLIGQQKARDQLTRVLRSDRLGHAYLFSGPKGVGKTAFALTFAEIVNGIENLSDLGESHRSRKSSWFTHPDIHVFLPIPRTASTEELRSRLELLRDDPYEIVDFSLRPSITSDESSKNLQAFYAIDYFRNEIKPVARLKPNEGRRTVIIITQIERMRKEAANAFLKLLEEPAPDLMFILTTEHPDALLPTIHSRCQHIRFTPLQIPEIEQGLIEHDGLSDDEAGYLARVSGGNYAMTRFYDINTLKQTRKEIVSYFRSAYQQEAGTIVKMAEQWQNNRNREGQVALISVMEAFVRDLLVYRSTGERTLITNVDQLEVIRKFVENLQEARLEKMIDEISAVRPLILQNVSIKLLFTTLSLRLCNLMHGLDTPISQDESWRHIPAYFE